MHSNLTVHVMLFSLLVFNLGCGLKFGEKNPKPAPAKVQSARCLNQSIADLKVYFKGEAHDLQVESALSCLEEVFVAFKENIRGENKNAYTAREIATFIEKINFLDQDDARFSDEFLNELMFFKVALFGGQTAAITKSEVDLITAFIGKFKPDLIALNPHMKILTLNWTRHVSILEESAKEKQFLAAKAQFQKLISKLTNEFANGKRTYQIDNLLNFVVEILKFAQSEKQTIETVQKAGPFLKKFKMHLIGGAPSLTGTEWDKLGMTLHEAYFQALRFEYFLKSLDDNQTEKKWVIYEKMALDLTGLIENLLKTKERRYLTNAEIIEILQPLGQLIPKVQEFSEEMLDQFGDIKLVFLGDSPVGNRGWHESDLVTLQKKIPVLFENVGVLLDTVSALEPLKGAQLRSRLTYPEFLLAEAKVLNAIGNLSQMVEKSYDLQSLKKLLIGLANGPLKDSFKLPERFEQLFVAAVSAKKLLTAEPSETLSVSGFRLLLDVGARAYLNYSEYNLFLAGFKTDSVEFTSGLKRLWPKVKTTLLTELGLRPGHVIKTQDWVEFILVVQEQGVLKTKLTEAALISAFDAFWSHLLNRPEDRVNGVFRPGFDAVAVEQISPEVEAALGAQHHIAQIFAVTDGWSRDALVSEFQNHITSEINTAVKSALNDIMGFVQEPIALTLNPQGFLQILDVNATQFHQGDLTLSNVARSLSRLLIRSYAVEPQRIADLSAVTEAEMQVAFTQLKPIGVDFDVIDKSNTSFVKSRFLEANLFLSVSNGDLLASTAELHHLIIHIFSGIARAGEIKKDVLKNCAGENNSVAENCLLGQYLTNTKGFSGLPQFLEMRSQYTVEQLLEYNLNLLKAAGHIPKPTQNVLLSDADLFPHVVQYIEMVYARHDASRDNLLQKEEALAAFPVFKTLLADLVKSYKQIKEEDLQGVFIYILKYGRPPRPQSIGEVLKFVAFIKDKEQKDWTINSTRLDLGKIFNYIADATINAPTAVSAKPAGPQK